MIRKNFDILVLFIFCLFLFSFIIKNVTTDISEHLEHIIAINDHKKSYPPNFGFYLLINVLSGFSSKTHIMNWITIIILSGATMAKYILSKKMLSSLDKNNIKNYVHKNVTFMAMLLFFCFPIPDPFAVFVLDKMYLSRIAPTIWHNSTTIVVFPFALLLFWKQFEVLNTNKTSNKTILILNILVFVNIILKPSFIFVYVPVTFLLLLYKLKIYSRKEWLRHITPIVTAILMIVLQYYLIYQLGMGTFQTKESSVSFCIPFTFFSLWIPTWYIPISFLLSFLFPLFMMIAYKEIFRYNPFLYSLYLLVFGILISAIFIESGPRMTHGNFMWQTILCSYLLFLSSVSFLVSKKLQKSLLSKREITAVILLVLHAVSGVLYILKIILTKAYY